MKRRALTLFVSACCLWHSLPAAPPNIILIFADDLGWKDVGWQGADYFETPQLDRLASESLVFSSAYAAAGNCAPSRACMLSGTYTPRHHVYAVNTTDRGPKHQQRLIPIPNRSGLAMDNVTMADALKAAGYATGIFGKWHLSGKDGASPRGQGFDVVVEKAGAANQKGSQEDPKGVFTLTEHAMKFIEANRHKPFFCYLPHHAIHTPHQARKTTLQRFREKRPGVDAAKALYAACLYDFDESVGRLIDKLDSLGLRENTLVVFTSDNGGTQQSSQEPLRGNKGSYYEGGIREPFFIRWPAVVKQGRVTDVPVINIDLYPTFLAAAGAATPEGKVLDGTSLLPLLEGGTSLPREAIFWHFPGYLDVPVIRGRDLDVRTGFRSRPVTVIRKGDWKLHLFHEEWQLDGGRAALDQNKAVELYHLGRDVGEHDDLSLTEPAKRDELLEDMLAWQKSVDALLPSEKNPAYDPTAAARPSGKGKRQKKATETPAP
jgi:arylsulfatase A-like enzyme